MVVTIAIAAIAPYEWAGAVMSGGRIDWTGRGAALPNLKNPYLVIPVLGALGTGIWGYGDLIAVALGIEGTCN